ncbi:hypothetical protein [Neisseria musculi]|uniref:Uncharacterized protein n=1 Tax=Neisseria musculi TaxID=1815583 RepID=A0A7H1ME96_9NEIS|nr:hypothetical protein [Neisseria musculi]QNT59961.1 hypothetical protein H7A79_1644 [Neisseria musculi]
MQTIETHSLVINVTEENSAYGCTITNGWGDTILELPPTHNTKINACKRALMYLTENDLQAVIEAA